MTHAEVKDLHIIFKSIDTNQDKLISRDEFYRFCNVLNFKEIGGSKEKLMNAFYEKDSNNDGKLSFCEFINMIFNTRRVQAMEIPHAKSITLWI